MAKKDFEEDCHTCCLTEDDKVGDVKGSAQGREKAERVVKKEVTREKAENSKAHCIGLPSLQVTALGMQS